MPRPRPLPAGLAQSFSTSEAVALGHSADALRRAELRRPYPGVRTFEWAHEEDLRARCRQYLPRMRDWQFFSHETALALHGAPVPTWPRRPAIHVSAHRPAREPRVVGIVGHRLQTREMRAVTDADGLRIEHPVRAWRQTGTLWRLDDLVAAADYLVSGDRPLASVAELREEVAMMGDARRRILDRALRDVRVGVRSPRETKLRLVLGRAGLPEPEINWALRDGSGRFVAELDLAYPRWRVAPEYDGRVHADDHRQFEKDGDRWDRIRATGWDHVRILNHHMRGDGREAVDRVRSALRRAGWSDDR